MRSAVCGTFGSIFHDVVPIMRLATAGAVCAALLAGCGSLGKDGIWPSTAEETSETADAATASRTEPVESETEPTIALDSQAISQVQRHLTELGYEPGSIDGLVGPRTRAAVRRYQKDAGLPVDGRITQDLLARLAEQDKDAQTSETDGDPIETLSNVALGPMPVPQVGSRYVYTGGEVWTVLGVTGDKVDWQSNKDSRFATYGNFLMPRLSWVTPSEKGKRVHGTAPADAWPSQTDGQWSFSTTSLVQYGPRPDSQSLLHETWNCRLEDSVRITVRAGIFETRKIVCEGLYEPDGVRVQRVWFYAPQVGHYVLLEETEARRLRARSELLAIEPSKADWPPVARAGLGWALEHALETARPGESMTWTSSAVETEVTIEPGPRRTLGKKRTCRNFIQIWSDPGGQRVYPGLACRAASGRWVIPGLEPGLKVADKSR